MREGTKAVRGGRGESPDPKTRFHPVNPPVMRASTYLFPTMADLRAAEKIAPGDGLT